MEKFDIKIYNLFENENLKNRSFLNSDFYFMKKNISYMILSKTLIISEGENDVFLGYKETRFFL